MVSLPIRWHEEVGVGALSRKFRRQVASAPAGTLTAGPAAISILSHVSGRYLTPTQVTTLGHVMSEHLSVAAWAVGSGNSEPRFPETLSRSASS